MRSAVALTFAALLACLSSRASAHALDVLNALRVKDCSGHLAPSQKFRENSKLAAAAKHVKKGVVVRDALKRADYRADQSAVIHLSGYTDDAALKRVLAKNYCATLVDASLTELGIFYDGRELALVFAAPFAPPSPDDAVKVAGQVLRLVNAARAQPQRCGNKKFPPVPPLTFNERLLVAATTQAKDLAKRGVISHQGADGSSPGDRATRSGYAWKNVGENVAAGQVSAQEVVAGWLGSPGHCRNIMDPDFTQMAVAYVINTRQEIGIYWAQVFGRPK